MTAFEARLASAFLLALLGGLHCAGMCGGFVAALHAAAPKRAPGVRFALAYNTGRIMSYSMAGAVAGLLGAGLFASRVLPLQVALLLLAAAVLVGIAFSLLAGTGKLRRLEPVGSGVWRLLRPLAQRTFPPRSAGGALLTGLAWGWIPCGMVYAALPLALVAGGIVQGAAVMLAFGLGTLPNMAALEAAASRLGDALRGGVRARLQPAAGVVLLLFALSDLAHAARIAGWQSTAVGWLASVCHG
ncbi:MAG: sulfite exporter TauE/SafE family protein [Burkholderiaceae bacterium]|nr:sulfite exporter TauE/SafE family protein [Burkholderiaceae bacterium]